MYYRRNSISIYTILFLKKNIKNCFLLSSLYSLYILHIEENLFISLCFNLIYNLASLRYHFIKIIIFRFLTLSIFYLKLK